ncbi:hypothetical protein LTR62_005124 [Meristemomyces frigidus]|uniref:BZIP domain-containing protein n=1 Tax=Meristemomyces frigidus TaxID=1508187 RepID=A0AAN7TJ54_9PEZI|nr:hypothetical protein LTR62_005124 [Meristemomyces frigidus]
MAFPNSRLGYHHPRRDARPPAYFDDDNSSVLDPAILDTEIMQSPSNAQYRKDSFANSNNAVLSPAESQAWEHHYNGLPLDPAGANAPAFRDEHNVFVRPPPAATYGHDFHGGTWPLDQNPENCRPTSGLQFPATHPPYEPAAYTLHGPAPHQPLAHPSQFNTPHGEHGFIPAPQVQTPMSPHSHQDWMGMAQQELEGRPQVKRMRPNSPSNGMMDFARPNGIRKKNGRIDIPQERNIQTIDDLIDNTTDEELLKELKQQKRLLRNREAALASRQRKKKHTEDLEVKEKSFTGQIRCLEREVHELSAERQQREDERQGLVLRLQDRQRAMEVLQEEVRALKITHDEETSQLRRRINLLTEQQALEAPAMSAAPSSTGFTDFNADMEALNMGHHEWEDFFVVPDSQQFEDVAISLPPSPTLEKRPSASTIIPTPSKTSGDASADQPLATTGLLFMLLLCGAFVASKPPNARPADLPSMPVEVQAAAPTVLKDLLAGAGNLATDPMRTHQHSYEPQPSAIQSVNQRASNNNNSNNNRMEQMHRHLTAPTRQQEYDQAFSLTTAQYASITNPSFSIYPEPGVSEQQSQQPSTIATALAKMQHDVQLQHHSHSQSHIQPEVYSRSLLWDQLSEDVVRRFREVVRECEEVDLRAEGVGGC